jgi:hypothetical protein
LPAGLTKGKIPLPTLGFLFRAGLTAFLMIAAHQLRWGGMRFLTSEAILRLSAWLGMATVRNSFDTIQIQGELFQFGVSCTSVDVVLGTLPLIWRLDLSILRNLLRSAAVALALFGLNVIRLELGQFAHGHGVPWILAHEIPSGFALFAVWVAIWQSRDWQAWQYCAPWMAREPAGL